jgi:hypothetical protein
MGTRREPRALTDSRAATVTFVLALLGFPAMIVLPDLGLLLGAGAALLAWTLLRRGRVDDDWRRLMIASAIIGASTTLIYVMDTVLVAGFRG